MNNKSDFEKFDATMRKLMQVPHSELKAKLDAEKAAKKRKPKAAEKKGGNDKGN
jgi:hypothetical protein